MDHTPATPNTPDLPPAPEMPGTLEVVVTPAPGKIYQFMGIFITRYVKELGIPATQVDVQPDHDSQDDPPRFRLKVDNVTPSQILVIRARLSELGFQMAEVALTA